MDKLIVYFYLALILIIGIYSTFKIKNAKDFYLAGKNASIWGVAGSLLATILGSSAILGTINLSVKQGWASSWMLLVAAIGLLILYPLVPYVKKYGTFTMPELIGTFYGKEANVVASVIIPIAWIGIIAAQMIGAAKVLSGFFDLNYSYGVVISGLVFIIYTISGGQKSIIKTDILQSGIILSGLMLTFYYTYTETTFLTTDLTQFDFPFNANFSLTDLLILLITYATTYTVGPDIYSRLFCAKDDKTASRSILVVVIILIPFAFILSYLGIYAYKMFPDADFARNSGLIYLILAKLPDWGVGLMIAALLSAIMSSADTTLLTSSSILSELFGKKLESEGSIFNTRIWILVIGLLSMFLALQLTSIIASLFIALTIFSGAFIIPVISGLLGYKAEKKYVLVAMITGGAVALVGKIVSIVSYQYIGNIIIILAFVSNAMVLFYPLFLNDDND